MPAAAWGAGGTAPGADPGLADPVMIRHIYGGVPESLLPGSTNWFGDFLGVAYRYFDLRMNVVPLFRDREAAAGLWNETIHWWVPPTIRLRFVEGGDDVWFILAAESARPDTNKAFFKVLPRSENYERFKRGHGGEAYIRTGIYAKKYRNDVKDDALCDCSHEKLDHDDGDASGCMYEDCPCEKFESFQVTLLKKKKVVTDIRFMPESQIREDSLAWNCLYVNRYRDLEIDRSRD